MKNRRISATASLNTKLKFFSEFENINPFAAFTIEEDVPEDWTDEQAVARGEELYDRARKLVEKKIGADIKSAKGDKAKMI